MSGHVRGTLAFAALGAIAACSPMAPTTPSLDHSDPVAPALSVLPPPSGAFFVIGDAEVHDIGADIDFWGAQWWKNNTMTGAVDDGAAAFKGFANAADAFCGGTWSSNTGNSSVPPETIPSDFTVIVTSTLASHDTTITGNIVEVVTVHQDGGYAPNVGHEGTAVVTAINCGP
jgi:hypothetical protein